MVHIGKVLDCWFESGSMPFAQFHYPFENKQKFEDNFPGDFIMLEGLQAILEKEPVLSTVNALDLQSDPSRVEGEYQRHVATFIPMGDVNEYSARLLRRISGSKTPKGMLVAPYGYGKTSTLAFLWHECESNGLVAVPPFYCANLLDILDATYGWVRYRLENRQTGLLPVLDADEHNGKIRRRSVDHERQNTALWEFGQQGQIHFQSGLAVIAPGIDLIEEIQRERLLDCEFGIYRNGFSVIGESRRGSRWRDYIRSDAAAIDIVTSQRNLHVFLGKHWTVLAVIEAKKFKPRHGVDRGHAIVESLMQLGDAV